MNFKQLRERDPEAFRAALAAQRKAHVDRHAERTRIAAESRQPNDPLPVPAPIPFDKWPRLARLIAWRKRDGETGVGDTLARILGNVGADAMAHWYEKITGHDCGCADRRAKLNTIFRYVKEG